MVSESKKHFAKNLKKCRTAAGLSQIRLAEILSYTSKSVSKWETGTALPPAEILPVIAKTLHTDLNTLFDFREDPIYFLGIDGGGTKTRFMLTDIDGNILGKTVLGASNPSSVGYETSIGVIHSGIKELCGNIPYGKISVFAGISGCSLNSNREFLQHSLDGFKFSNLVVGTDAENVISLGLGDNDGIVSILGTGSITYTSVGGKLRPIGGYGHLIGDIFSGSELGRSCLEAVLYDLDGSGPHTSMTGIVLKRVKDSSELLSNLYKNGKIYLASFSDVVFHSVAAGDEVASNILNSSIERFATQLISALDDFESSKAPVPIYFAGGMTYFAPYYIKKIEHIISKKHACNINIISREPVVGAVLLAGAPCVKDQI